VQGDVQQWPKRLMEHVEMSWPNCWVQFYICKWWKGCTAPL